MGVTVTDFANVRERAAELRLTLSSDLAILPRHFSSATSAADLVHEADAATLRKLLNNAGLDVQQLEPPGGRLPSVVQKSADWISPTIFVGSLLLTQNPYAIQVALNVLASYLTDFLRGRPSGGTARISIVVERTNRKTYKQVSYEGPPSGIKDLASVLTGLRDE
jgi:hypothetical protein